VPYDQVQSKRLAVFHLNVVDVSQAEMLLTPKTPQRNGQYGDDWIEWNWSEWQICDRTGMLGGEKRKYGQLQKIVMSTFSILLLCQFA